MSSETFVMLSWDKEQQGDDWFLQPSVWELVIDIFNFSGPALGILLLADDF